jgi:predicted metal-binding protein
MTEPAPGCVTLTQRQFGPERTDRPAVEIKAKAATTDLERLVDSAKRLGATDAMVAPVSVLAVSEVMRLKCQIPACWGYNASPFCPPRTATAEEMQAIIAEYNWALLLAIPRPTAATGSAAKLFAHSNQVKEVVGRTEVEAQYGGLLDTMGFPGGPCTLCGMFSEEWIRAFKKGAEVPYCPLIQRTAPLCLHFYHGRPAAQAVGLDMYLAAKNVGWEAYLYPPTPVTDGHMDWPCLPGVYPVLVK